MPFLGRSLNEIKKVLDPEDVMGKGLKEPALLHEHCLRNSSFVLHASKVCGAG